MVKIDHVFVSDAIINTDFCCDLSFCKGWCCVEGDVGAPLRADEVRKIGENLDAIKPYLCSKGIDEINARGYFAHDETGNLVTPLVKGMGCAFAVFQDGITMCAIERAFREGKTDFRKPISCYLFPIRLHEISGFVHAYLEERSECTSAKSCGKAKGLPIWKFLKTPLEMRFGKVWYEKLENSINNKPSPDEEVL